MANDNSTVQITVKVVDDNSSKAIGEVKDNLNSLGDAGAGSSKKVADGFKQMGEAGIGSGEKVRQGLRSIDGAAASSLGGVQSLTSEFGVALPEAVAASTAGVGELALALGGVAGILAGIAAIGIYKLYDEYVNLNSEADKFYQTLKKTSEVDFSRTRSLETSQAREGRALRNYSTAPQNAKQSSRFAISSLLTGDIGGFVGNTIAAHDTAEVGIQSGYKVLELGRLQIDQQHQLALAKIEANHSSDSQIVGEAKITAELQKQREIRGETQAYDRKVEQSMGNGSPRGAGDALANEQMRSAEGKASADRIVRAREESLAIMKAQDARIQAQLTGEEKYARKRSDDIRELTVELTNAGKAAEIPANIRSINTRYLEDASERAVKLANQTGLAIQQSGAAGLRGQARIDADRDIQINRINSNPALAEHPDQAASERAAADQAQKDKSLALQQQFNDRVAQMDASRSDRYISENERIENAAKRAVATITKEWRDSYGQLGEMDQRRLDTQQKLNAEIAKINQDATRQKQEASQRLEDQTERMEAEGARAGIGRDQERTQQIVDEYNQRYQQLEELREKAAQTDQATADKYRRQEIAAEEIKNGKLIEQQRQMRDRLAGQLRGFFTNPLDELRRKGEEAASKIAASFILKMQDRSGMNGGYGDAGIGGVHGGGVLGLGNIFNRKNSSVTAGSSTLHATTATIYVQSATFAGGSGGGGNIGGGFGAFSGSSSDAGTSSVGSSSGSVAGSISGGPGVVSSISSTTSAVPGLVASANSLGKEMGATGNITNKIPGASKISGSGVGKFLSGKGAGLASGGLGLFSAFESNGGFGGALSGAMGGAKIGAEFGGPIGAAIGAVGGAVMGFIGFGGRGKAEDYDRKQVRPRIGNDLLAYESGSMDYQTAFDDFDSLSREAKMATRQWGSGGTGYYNDHIKSEIATAQTRLTREQIAGRSEFGMSAAQFHSGGIIDGFGSMATSGDEGWVHAKRGEIVMHEQAAATHSVALQAMLAGASHSDMAAYYGGSKRAVAASSGPINLNFNSHDAKGAYQLFMDNKHHIRAALNQSYAENSGGADFA